MDPKIPAQHKEDCNFRAENVECVELCKTLPLARQSGTWSATGALAL